MTCLYNIEMDFYRGPPFDVDGSPLTLNKPERLETPENYISYSV